jgi:hypothetical protein
MAIREVDAITDAIIETEREIAGDPWGQEDTERDTSGDTSLEDMGEGLEGQQEPEDEDEPEGDEPEGEEETEGEGETEPAIAAKPGEAAKPDVVAPTERNLVPPGKLREANEARRALEVELDALKAELAKGSDTRAQLDLLTREIAALKAPRVEPRVEPAVVKKAPDMFEDPEGFANYIQDGFRSELAKRDDAMDRLRVGNSMAVAHVQHKDTFEKAYAALQELKPDNPDDFAAGRRIVTSPNPGEALVGWYKDRTARAEVGNDLEAYKERLRTETREALMKDPEFKKQLIAELRGDAARGDDGKPRTITRVPRSLNGAAGSNLGLNRGDPRGSDDSDQGIAESAWR